MEEFIDIYTDNYEYLGIAEKRIAHEKGLWHRVFTCVILNSSQSTIYLQKRRPNRYSFSRPDYLDISVGGHYKAGEQIKDGIREVYEETGLSSKEISFEDLIPIGIRQTASTITKEYIANEFQHIFLLDYQGNPEGLLRDNDESKGFVELSIENTIDLLTLKTDAIKGQYYYLCDENAHKMIMTITLADFVPAYLATDKFVLRLFIAARRYINQENTDIIFW